MPYYRSFCAWWPCAGHNISAIEFAVSGGVVDGEDGVVNEPMQWVVTVYKNGKEIEKKSLVFRDGKEISTDDLNLYYN